MSPTLDTAAAAHWQAVHAAYVTAHQHYLHLKLAQASDEVAPTSTMHAARSRLGDAQQALADFFVQHAASA